jgi:hypothetical protein
VKKSTLTVTSGALLLASTVSVTFANWREMSSPPVLLFGPIFAGGLIGYGLGLRRGGS